MLCGITLIGWLIKRAKERRKEIVKLKNGNYKIDSIIFNPDTMKLTNEEIFRVRVGNYRILYEVISDYLTVLVTRIKHRREVYR